MDVLKLISLIAGIMGGLIAVSYKQIAERRGWPIGELFYDKPPGYIIIISFLTFIASCIMSFQTFKWWQAILIIIFSWSLAFVSIFSLKSFVQYLSLLLTVLSIILYIISFIKM